MIGACLRERSAGPWWEAMRKSVISITKFAAAVAAAVAVSACEAEKSRNPLSPNVAGPIAGVSISPPTPVNPINGAEVLNTAPVRLVFNNGSTNGERPLFYVVELASDAAFTNKVFAQSKVTPGSTQTSIVVDAALTAERTYYWRAKADDGANESDYSSVAKFDIVVPIVIEAPVPMSPVSGLVASSTRPVLVVNNAGVQGRAGRVEYWFEVSLDQAFSKIIIQQGVERSSGAQTSPADARPAVEHAALLARRGIQRHDCGPLVAHAELPDARWRRPSAWPVALAFAGPAAACGWPDT